MFRLSCHIHRNFAAAPLFLRTKKIRSRRRRMYGHGRTRTDGRMEGKNGKTVLKFPLAASAAAAAGGKLGLSLSADFTAAEALADGRTDGAGIDRSAGGPEGSREVYISQREENHIIS